MFLIINIILSSILVFAQVKQADECKAQPQDWRTDLSNARANSSCMQKFDEMERCCYQVDLKACSGQVTNELPEIDLTQDTGIVKRSRPVVEKALIFHNIHSQHAGACKSFAKEIRQVCQGDAQLAAQTHLNALEEKQVACFDKNSEALKKKAEETKDFANSRTGENVIAISCSEKSIRQEKAEICSQTGKDVDDEQGVKTADANEKKATDDNGTQKNSQANNGENEKQEAGNNSQANNNGENDQGQAESGSGGGGGSPGGGASPSNSDKAKKVRNEEAENDAEQNKIVEDKDKNKKLLVADESLTNNQCIDDGATLRCAPSVVTEFMRSSSLRDDGSGAVKLRDGIISNGVHYKNVVVASSATGTNASISSFVNGGTVINQAVISSGLIKIVSNDKLQSGSELLGD